MWVFMLSRDVDSHNGLLTLDVNSMYRDIRHCCVSRRFDGIHGQSVSGLAFFRFRPPNV
jgi:hypothetical protein